MGLSEPRKKQRISADPRNKAWKDDTNKFGYKLMERMGWKEGQGLGQKEDGIVDAIKAHQRVDNRGIGATKKTVDNWLENTSAFDELLQNLNAAQGEEEKPKEPEPEQSLPREVLHGRLYHRKKFVRNKLVSNYDQEELGRILGKKRVVESDVDSGRASPAISETSVDSSFQTKTQSISVQDYFAQKMKAKLSKSLKAKEEDEKVEEKVDKKEKKSKKDKTEKSEKKNKSEKKEKSEKSEKKEKKSKKDKSEKKSEDEPPQKKRKRDDDVQKKSKKNS